MTKIYKSKNKFIKYNYIIIKKYKAQNFPGNKKKGLTKNQVDQQKLKSRLFSTLPRFSSTLIKIFILLSW